MSTFQTEHDVTDAEICASCTDKGHCCREFVLTHSGLTADMTVEQAEAYLDAKNLGFFRVLDPKKVKRVTPGEGKHAYYCTRLGSDGLCTDYENRPDTCSSYKPKQDPLCIYHEVVIIGEVGLKQ